MNVNGNLQRVNTHRQRQKEGTEGRTFLFYRSLKFLQNIQVSQNLKQNDHSAICRLKNAQASRYTSISRGVLCSPLSTFNKVTSGLPGFL